MVKIPEANKHAQIDKAQSTMTAIIIGASVVTVFCLMSSKALLSQAAYQRKVINATHVADKQLQANVVSAKELVKQYNQVFEGANPSNIIGGQNDTSPNAVPPNGDNARIVLDALPSSYDFPALLSSLSKLLSNNSITNPQVVGTDESASVSSSDSVNPTPQSIQVIVSGRGTYASVQSFVKDLERSIRPFDVVKMELSGPQDSLNFTMTVNTYYQPAKSLSITDKVVK